MNYDVFISFKNLDADGMKSRDCEMAEGVYHFLQNKGVSVFFSNETLEKLGSSAYLKAIDDALDSAKIMVVVGSSKANIESQWVESEWSGFINDIRSGIKKNAQIYSVIEGMATSDLQRSLRQYQSFTYSKENLERLYNFISNALGDDILSRPGVRDIDKPFLMPIEDVFSITGRGVVLTGKIENGIVREGDTLEIVGLSNKTKTVTCAGIEMFRKLIDRGEAGDNVGLLITGIAEKEVGRGMAIAEQGRIKPYKHFEAEVYILTEDEGGCSKPFYNNYSPQFYLRTLDISGVITLPEGVSSVKPGDNVSITVELASFAAIDVGLRFAIRENNKTIGAGQITRAFN